MLNQPLILVMDDFTDYSLNALQIAEDIRSKTNGAMIIVFPLYLSLNQHERAREFEMKAQKRLEAHNISAEIKIVGGDFLTAVNKLIGERNIHLFIIGESLTHPFLGVQDFYSSKLIRHISIPILIVRKAEHVDRLDVLVDPRYSMDKIISIGEEFSSLLSTELGIVSIWKESEVSSSLTKRMGYPFISSDLLPEQRRDFLHKFETIIKHRSTELMHAEINVDLPQESLNLTDQLLQIIHSDQADMIILEKHHDKIWENFFNRSPIYQLLKKFDGNILIYST